MPRRYTVPLTEARPAFLAELDSFVATALDLDDHDLVGPSRAHGWSRVDCLVHVRMGLQELLAGIPATTTAAPDVDAASYWSTWMTESTEDPIPGILMTRRTASAYSRPSGAVEHLQQVATGLRHLIPTMPDTSIAFQGHVLTAGDLLATWAVELVVHHHDLDAPRAAAAPDRAAVKIGRLTAEALRDDLPEADDLTTVLAGFRRI